MINQVFVAAAGSLDWWAVAGVTISAVALILGIGFFLASRRPKQLTYVISESTSLVSSAKLARSLGLEIRLGDATIAKPWLTVSALRNTGKVPVTKADFDRPIELRAVSGANIAMAIEFDSPSGEPSMRFDATCLTVEPLLLNRDEELRILIISDGDPKGWKTESRIAGVARIEDLERLPLDCRTVLGLALLFAASLAMPGIEDPRPVETAVFVVATAIAVSYTTVEVRRLRGEQRSRRNRRRTRSW